MKVGRLEVGMVDIDLSGDILDTAGAAVGVEGAAAGSLDRLRRTESIGASGDFEETRICSHDSIARIGRDLLVSCRWKGLHAACCGVIVEVNIAR